jgi:hypothetical protein
MLKARFMLGNIDVSVLTKLNDLAERYGLKTYDFVATYRWNEEIKDHVLQFEMPAQGNELREERFEKMLKAIGIDESNDDVSIVGPEKIIDALDDALKLAPKRRGL